MDTTAWLFCLFLGLSVPAACVAEESVVEDNDCDLGAAKPILVEAGYPDHRYVLKEHNETFETATLDKDVSLQIHGYSCVDSVSEIFTFTTPTVSGKEHDFAFWSAFARKQLAALKVNEDDRYMLKAIDAFLAKLSQYKPIADKIEVCRDGSLPDRDGCSWQTGGGNYIRLGKEKGRMTIAVSVDTSG